MLKPASSIRFEVVAHIVVGGGEKLVAIEDRVGAGEEAEHLRLAAERAPSRREPNARLRHQYARGRHHAHEVERIDRRAVLQRRAWHGDKRVDRHALGMRIEIGERLEQPGTVLDAFAHADDAAAADLDAGAPHAL